MLKPVRKDGQGRRDRIVFLFGLAGLAILLAILAVAAWLIYNLSQSTDL